MQRFKWLFILLLLISPAVLAEPRIVITKYEIFDKNSLLAQSGTLNPGGINFCSATDHFTHNFFSNITAGDWFTVNITLKNVNTDPSDNENSGTLYQNQVLDPYGFVSGLNYQNNPAWIGNFSTISPFSLAPGEEKVFSGTMNSSAYTYMGNYWLDFWALSSGSISAQNPVCQKFRLPIGYDPVQFYMNVSKVGITGFNDYTIGPAKTPKTPSNPYYCNNAPPYGPDYRYYNEFCPPVGQPNTPYKQNWTLYFNFTVKNIGLGIPGDSWADATLLTCASSAWSCFNFTSTPEFRFGRNISLAMGVEKRYDCLLKEPVNQSNVVCSLQLENSTYDFKAQKYFSFGQLGTLNPGALPPQPTNWDPFIADPYPQSLYALPGSNYTWHVPVQKFGLGNYTFTDNLNLTWDLYDGAGGVVARMSELVIQNPSETFNSTSSAAQIIKLVNLTITIPPGAQPQYGIVKLFATTGLQNTARPDEKLDNIVCPGDHLFHNNLSEGYKNICIRQDDINSSRLLYLLNFSNLVAFVSPGGTYSIPFEARNGLSKPVTYSFSHLFKPKQFQTDPGMQFQYIPNPINVGQAFSTDVGKAFGSLSVTVPLNAQYTNYTYLINVSSATEGIWDTATLTLVVTPQDVEVVAITKSPDQFIYDPQVVPRVDLEVLVRNNGIVQENVTLDLAIYKPDGTGQTLVGCGGSNFSLNPSETKKLDCTPDPLTPPDKAHVDLTEFDNDNVVVVADLSLLTGIDIAPQNNRKVEVLTLISKQQNTETVPEIGLPAFIMLLLVALFVLRKKSVKP